MTREEEKYTTLDTEQCKWWVNHLFNMAKEKACNSHNFDDAQEIQSAQDKIIKALEQEPCEDCVSRQAVINLILEDAVRTGTGHRYTSNQNMNNEINEVRALPSITPTRKKVKWILLDECSNSGYYCSECQKKVVKEGWSDTVKKIKYCPNCGAEMEK